MNGDLEDNPKWAALYLEDMMDIMQHRADEDSLRRVVRYAKAYIRDMMDEEDNNELTDGEKRFLILRNQVMLLCLHPLPQVAMSKKMERSGKKKKVEDSDDQDYKKKVLLDHSTPGVVGNLGSVSEYAKTQKISVRRAKRELEKNLTYTLHKPRRQRGAFQPVLVFDMDEQWVADLIEVQLRGIVIFSLSLMCYPNMHGCNRLRRRLEKMSPKPFDVYSPKPKRENLINYKRMRVKNFTTERFRSS